ncbi:unnamed protein product, partial [Rotaria sordida]
MGAGYTLTATSAVGDDIIRIVTPAVTTAGRTALGIGMFSI